MKFHVLNRKTHYWASIIFAAPLFVILATGIVLQVKKQFAWVQPTELRGTGKTPTVSFEQILASCQTVRETRVETWDDISRIDVRPNRGMLKVTTRDNWEIQLNAETGAVLQTAYRRSDIIEAMHDGSWFHETVKMWLFLPTGIVLLLLWLTGMYLFLLPYVARRRRKRPPLN